MAEIQKISSKTCRWVAAGTAVVLSMDITREELRQIMSEVLREELSRMRNPETSQNYFSVNEAVSYLKSIGFPTTINCLYTLLSRGKITANTVNGKLSFERSELNRLKASKTKTNSKQEAAAKIRESAIAKDKRAPKIA